MSFMCFERPGKLPDYFYPEILKVDLGDFKITDEFRADTAGLNDEESRMFAEILFKFCKDGSCPEDVAKLGAKINTLWSKYKLALYKDKLNKYVDTMEVDEKNYLRLLVFSLNKDCYDLSLYHKDEPDPLYYELCEIKEQFLALKHYSYHSYSYTDRYNCSNVKEYSKNILAELQKIKKYLVKNKVNPDFYDNWLLDEVKEQLETIIEYSRLIKNKGKRNDFLRTFDFGFFNNWKEKLENIDRKEGRNTTDDYGNTIVDINPGGDPKFDDD